MITENSLKAFILNYLDCNIEIEKVNLQLAWLQQDWVEKKNLIDASRYSTVLRMGSKCPNNVLFTLNHTTHNG